MKKAILSGIILALLPLLGAQQFQVGQHRYVAASGGSGLGTAYKMNEGTGLSFIDYSGNSNTGTVSGAGAISWGTWDGMVGSPYWNATGNAVASTASYTNFGSSSSFCAAAWIDPSSHGTYALMGNMDVVGTPNRGWRLDLQFSTSNPRFLLANNLGASNFIQVSASSGSLTGLHYVGVQYTGSGSASGVTIYIDGSAVSTTTDSDTLSGSPASGLPLMMGALNDGSEELLGLMAFTQVKSPCTWTSTNWAANYAAGPGIY